MIETAIEAMQKRAARIEGDRARLYGAARAIADEAGLAGALAALDAAKLRLVRDQENKGGWIA